MQVAAATARLTCWECYPPGAHCHVRDPPYPLSISCLWNGIALLYCRFTPTQPTDPDANRVWSELLKRHSAAQAASHTSTPPPRVSSLSGNASRPHSAAPGGRPLPARPMSASPAPVTVDSWGGRTSTAPLHHQHQQRPWSSSPTAMSRSPADHPGGQQLLSLYGGTSRPTSAYQPLARAVSAREQPRPRFSSVSVATIAQLGPDFRPPAVSGFSEPEAELVVPDPGDARWVACV
jgi:hypothetical protein